MRPDRRLEWERAVLGWTEALERGRPTPAGGSLAWVTLAGAAALAAKLEALEAGDSGRFAAWAGRFTRAAAEDAEGFRAARTPADRAAFLRRSLDLLDEAGRFLEEARRAQARCSRPAVRPDWKAVVRLAGASVEVLWENARVNEKAWGVGVEPTRPPAGGKPGS